MECAGVTNRLAPDNHNVTDAKRSGLTHPKGECDASRTGEKWSVRFRFRRDKIAPRAAEDSRNVNDEADLGLIVVDRRIDLVGDRLFDLVIPGLSDFP
jgi:hypothetical protein